MNKRIVALVLIVLLSLATVDSLYCDYGTHTTLTPLNIIKSVRWDLHGNTVTIGNDYPVSGIELENGTLLATWANEQWSDYSLSNISGSLSKDGVNWSPPFILVNGNGYKVSEEQYVYNNGSLYEFYAISNETRWNETIEPSSLCIRELLDGTVSNWSSDTFVANWSHYLSLTSNPIQTDSGRWIIPVEYVDPINVSHGYSGTFYSDDFSSAGLQAHWAKGQNIEVKDDSMWELSIAQQSDESILGLIRYDNKGGHFWKTLSIDNGTTWSASAQSDIPSPNARPHIIRLQDSRILLAWNDISTDSQGGRNPLSVKILGGNAINLAQNNHQNEYHNMGIIQRRNGDIIILAATNDIPWSYWYFSGGISYVTQYVSGVQSYKVPQPF